MTIELTIPTKWNELSPRQIRRISGFIHSGYESKKLGLLVYFVLLNIKWYQFRKAWRALKVLKHVPLSELMTHYSFIFNKTDLTTFLPKIGNLYSPADRLGNITIEEMAHADDAFLKYHATGNQEYLRILTAILYREVEGYGKRTPFIKEELSARLSKLKKVKPETLLAVMQSFKGCRFHIEKKFPKIFPKPKKDQAVKPKKKTPSSSQFSKLILEMSGGKFGNYRETATTNVYDFLAEFNNLLSKTKS